MFIIRFGRKVARSNTRYKGISHCQTYFPSHRMTMQELCALRLFSIHNLKNSVKGQPYKPENEQNSGHYRGIEFS